MKNNREKEGKHTLLFLQGHTLYMSVGVSIWGSQRENERCVHKRGKVQQKE